MRGVPWSTAYRAPDRRGPLGAVLPSRSLRRPHPVRTRRGRRRRPDHDPYRDVRRRGPRRGRVRAPGLVGPGPPAYRCGRPGGGGLLRRPDRPGLRAVLAQPVLRDLRGTQLLRRRAPAAQALRPRRAAHHRTHPGRFAERRPAARLVDELGRLLRAPHRQHHPRPLLLARRHAGGGGGPRPGRDHRRTGAHQPPAGGGHGGERGPARPTPRPGPRGRGRRRAAPARRRDPRHPRPGPHRDHRPAPGRHLPDGPRSGDRPRPPGAGRRARPPQPRRGPPLRAQPGPRRPGARRIGRSAGEARRRLGRTAPRPGRLHRHRHRRTGPRRDRRHPSAHRGRGPRPATTGASSADPGPSPYSATRSSSTERAGTVTSVPPSRTVPGASAWSSREVSRTST